MFNKTHLLTLETPRTRDSKNQFAPRILISDMRYFISYSSNDTKFVERLVGTLKLKSVEYWFAGEDIIPPQTWDDAIANALNQCEGFIVVLSKSSISSSNVKDEINFALQRNKKVVPVKVDNCDVPFRLMRHQFIDFQDDYDRGIEMLMRAVSQRRVSTGPDQNTYSTAHRPNRKAYLMAADCSSCWYYSCNHHYESI